MDGRKVIPLNLYSCLRRFEPKPAHSDDGRETLSACHWIHHTPYLAQLETNLGLTPLRLDLDFEVLICDLKEDLGLELDSHYGSGYSKMENKSFWPTSL